MFLPLILIVSALVSLWLAATILSRRVPGSRAFVFLTLATAEWSLASIGEWVAGSDSTKLLWAQAEYLGIVSVPPLWWAFASDYAGAPWGRSRRAMFATWIIPALTIAVAVSNPWHHALWTSITLREDGGAIYGHGWWFWVIQAYSHVLLLAASLVLVRAVRRSPLYRTQSVALVAAVVIPWAANIVYALGLSPVPGLDLTPPAFTLAGVLIAWALFRNRLFDLVPIARDQLVEGLSDAVLVIDTDRRLLDMNGAARRLASPGTPPACAGHDIDGVLPFLAGIPLNVPRAGITVRADTHAGSHWFDLRVVRVGARVGRHAWVVLLRDITEQQDVEIEHTALSKRLQEQQKRESLGVLTGGLAHDFNNLLAGILGNADTLAMQLSPSSQMGSSVGAILLGAQRAADIVSQMLAYAGERHGASEMVDLDAISREMLDLLRTSQARHCRLTYSGQPATIFADQVQVRQVAMNLIINASEAVDETTGVIDVSVGRETLTAGAIAAMRATDGVKPGMYAYIEVRDNGPGMDALTLSKIFTPFFTTKPAGHGLGLAAVQGIIRSHGGAMHIETVVGKGCCFRAWFPEDALFVEDAMRESPASNPQSRSLQSPQKTAAPAPHAPSAEGTPVVRRDP